MKAGGPMMVEEVVLRSNFSVTEDAGCTVTLYTRAKDACGLLLQRRGRDASNGE